MQEARLRGLLGGGPRRARTAGLLRATQTLSQLSYGPKRVLGKCSPEFELTRRTNACTLVVLRRADSEVDLHEAVDRLVWNEVNPLELRAVRGERVEFARHVGPADQPASRP